MRIYFIRILGFLLIFISLFLFFNKNNINISTNKYHFNNGCIANIEEKTVRGQSLSGLIEEGQKINILYGYFNCNTVKVNDVIAYKYAGNSSPIIKIIKAVPGDFFKLVQIKNGWNIIVNGKIVKNSRNESYILDKDGYSMISLYEKDYNGIIPVDTYLILGNLISGSVDSSRFGLINKHDILGKIVLKGLKGSGAFDLDERP